MMNPLPKRQPRCLFGDEPFEAGSEYFSLLDDQGLRKDYCPSCWNKMEKPKDCSSWKGKIPVKKRKPLSHDEKMMALFKTTEDANKKFVLALYLQRKQQLIKRTQTLFELPDTGEVFEVMPVMLNAFEGEALVQSLI